MINYKETNFSTFNYNVYIHTSQVYGIHLLANTHEDDDIVCVNWRVKFNFTITFENVLKFEATQIRSQIYNM